MEGMSTKKPDIAAASLGQRGGRATKAKLGAEHYRRIGKLGAASKHKKLSTGDSVDKRLPDE